MHFVGCCVILIPVLPGTVGGSPYTGGNTSYPRIEREGVVDMITWTELFAFGMFIIALISLVIQVIEKKK